MVVGKTHELIPSRQSNWLDKKSSNTQKRNIAKKDFQKDFSKLLPNYFYGKTRENVRNGVNLGCIKKDDEKKILEQQSKLTFYSIDKSYTNHDRYTFKQNEDSMDKSFYLGFSILEISKLLIYESYYDRLQPYLGEEKLNLHYMDTDSFVLRVNATDIMKDLKHLGDLFDFSNSSKDHELFSNRRTKKWIVNS